MSDEVKNRATIEAFWRAWNEERIDDAIEMYAPDARLRHFNQPIDVTGTNKIRDLMAQMIAMSPGLRSDVGHIFAVGDDVITENHWQGTPAGSDLHLTSDICYIFHFVDGKVTEQREYG
jgi:ketosteroid isomerase-like protein